MAMAVWEKVVLVIAAIGAINWGLHAFEYGLVDLVASGVTAQIVYVIIALCGVWALIKVFK